MASFAKVVEPVRLFEYQYSEYTKWSDAAAVDKVAKCADAESKTDPDDATACGYIKDSGCYFENQKCLYNVKLDKDPRLVCEAATDSTQCGNLYKS